MNAFTVEYVVAAFMTVTNCADCYVLPPGDAHFSFKPTSNPNWCVINRGTSNAAVKMEFGGPKVRLLMGRGVEPCGATQAPGS